jgi:SAM-dependent methyltransferase
MANEGNRQHWNRSGQTWVAHQRTFDRMLEPIGALLLDAAGAHDRRHILDVGCGYGTTTLGLTERAPHATVHGIDISDPMVAEARRRVPAATFTVADAQTADLGGPYDLPYDLIVSRFGVMFFDDPVVAFANLAAHAAPGGQLTFVCWHDEATSSAVWAGAEVIRAALPEPPAFAVPNAPGPFALADDRRIRYLLNDSGWTDISIEPHELDCAVGWPDSNGVEERLAVVLASEAGQAMRQQLPPDEQAAVTERARQSLVDRVVDGAVRTHASIWLVTARRPG